MKRIIAYFFEGILIILPIAITALIIMGAINWVEQLFGERIPGYLGLPIVVAGIILIGYLSSFFMLKPFFTFLEKVLRNTPIINIIYTAFKDLFSAFVGESKKFEIAVVVRVNNHTNLMRLGFLTRSSMEFLKIDDMVAVYVPHSYNFSGNFYLVPPDNIEVLEGLNGIDFMKFMVSAGVTELDLKKGIRKVPFEAWLQKRQQEAS